MTISNELVHKFYSPIDEYVDKFVSQKITKEEFLNAFEKHCEDTKNTISRDDFEQILRRGWRCGYDKEYSHDEYKKLISTFDEIVYLPRATVQKEENEIIDQSVTKSEKMPKQEYSHSVIFEGYTKHQTRTAEVAAYALYGIADDPQLEQVLIDFYNEQQRKLKESAIEHYGWYDGHFNYEYGFAKEMEHLEVDVGRKERRIERAKEKDKLTQKITNKLQELRDKNKADKLENIPHVKTQILREIAKENIGQTKSKDKWLVDTAIKEAASNFRK